MKTFIFDLDGTLVDLASGTLLLPTRELEKLPADIQCALVTRSPRAQVTRVLETFAMQAFFPWERIVCQEDTMGDKKTGEPFIKIRDVVGMEAVVIGDTKDDEIGARIAGYPCIRVSENTPVQDAIQKALQAFDRDNII